MSASLCRQLFILLPLMYLSVGWLTSAGMSVDPNRMPSVLTVARDMLICILVEVRAQPGVSSARGRVLERTLTVVSNQLRASHCRRCSSSIATYCL